MLEVKSDDAMRGWGEPCTMRQLGKGGKDGQKEESDPDFMGRSGVLTCVTPLILPLFDHSATDRLGVVGVRLRKGKLCNGVWERPRVQQMLPGEQLDKRLLTPELPNGRRKELSLVYQVQKETARSLSFQICKLLVKLQ